MQFFVVSYVYSRKKKSMKNFRFIALATLICMAMQIQVAQADELSKEEKKAIQEQLDSIMYNEAIKAVNDTMFTLEASRATFKTGYTINVTSSTNFITVKKGKASIQTAFNASISGANGMGGVTVDGTISNYRISTDKKSGDTMVSMSVLGVGISATVNIRIFKNGNKATAEIMPSFNSNNLRLSGILLPSEKSTVFKGRSL